MRERLRVQRGGTGDPVLLLLHGLGATGDVWQGVHELLPGLWPGSWITPDLPGHGGSAPLPQYSFGHLAAGVTEAVPETNRLTVLGHSLGGVVALALGSGWFGLRVQAVGGLGIKVAWTREEIANAASLASRSNPVYVTRDDAARRYLRLAGLAGLVDVDHPAVDAALVQRDGGWTLAFDPSAFAVGAPDMAGLLAAGRAAVVLAAGERDPMSTAAQLHALVPDPMVLPEVGHNAHVEKPAAVVPLIERLRNLSQP
jgi:pimeloyl-ACP methyl ester carboxylesterase